MGKSRVQTRIPNDTKEQLENYQEDRDLSESDAVRRLIQTGLAAEGYPVTVTDGDGPNSRAERIRETAFGWLERSVYASLFLGIGALIAGISALAFGTTPLPYVWFVFALGTTGIIALLSAAVWGGAFLKETSDTDTASKERETA